MSVHDDRSPCLLKWSPLPIEDRKVLNFFVINLSHLYWTHTHALHNFMTGWCGGRGIRRGRCWEWRTWYWFVSLPLFLSAYSKLYTLRCWSSSYFLSPSLLFFLPLFDYIWLHLIVFHPAYIIPHTPSFLFVISSARSHFIFIFSQHTSPSFIRHFGW